VAAPMPLKTTESWKPVGSVAAFAAPVFSSEKTPTHATRATPMINRLMALARTLSLPTSFPRPLVFNSSGEHLPTGER